MDVACCQRSPSYARVAEKSDTLQDYAMPTKELEKEASSRTEGKEEDMAEDLRSNGTNRRDKEKDSKEITLSADRKATKGPNAVEARA